VRPSAGVDPRFICYVMQSRGFLAEGEAELTGVAGQKRVPDQFLRDFPIFVEGAEQRAIADFLDAETSRIDTLIAKKRRMMSLLVRCRDAAIRSALFGEWPVVPLKRRWQVVDCKHRTPAYVDNGYPVVSPGDATPGTLDLSRCHRFVGEADFMDLTEGGRRPARGDIVYSRNASIGIAAFVDTDVPFCMGQDVCLITSDRQDQRFLTYALNTLGVDQLEVEKVGSTFSRINVAQIVEMLIPCPDVDKQRTIADVLDRVSERFAKLERKLARQIELVHEHRQALITAAVGGQLEIPRAA
jgi:type I restriction enzyme, S subunit